MNFRLYSDKNYRNERGVKKECLKIQYYTMINDDPQTVSVKNYEVINTYMMYLLCYELPPLEGVT